MAAEVRLISVEVARMDEPCSATVFQAVMEAAEVVVLVTTPPALAQAPRQLPADKIHKDVVRPSTREVTVSPRTTATWLLPGSGIMNDCVCEMPP